MEPEKFDQPELLCWGGAAWLRDCAFATPMPRLRAATAARIRFFIDILLFAIHRSGGSGLGVRPPGCFPFADAQEIGSIRFG
jgi:hypothetical protein